MDNLGSQRVVSRSWKPLATGTLLVLGMSSPVWAQQAPAQGAQGGANQPGATAPLPPPQPSQTAPAPAGHAPAPGPSQQQVPYPPYQGAPAPAPGPYQQQVPYPPYQGAPPAPGPYQQPYSRGQGAFGYGQVASRSARGCEPTPNMVKEFDYYEGSGPHPCYKLIEKQHKGLVIAGGVLFGLSYTLSLVVAPIMESREERDGKSVWNARTMYVPVLGPWLALGTVDQTPQGTSALLLDGMAQLGGATMLYFGLTSKYKTWVRKDLAGVQFVVSPTKVGRDSWGIGAVGMF